MKQNTTKNNRLPIFTERFRELQGDRSNTEFADFLGISGKLLVFIAMAIEYLMRICFVVLLRSVVFLVTT